MVNLWSRVCILSMRVLTSTERQTFVWLSWFHTWWRSAVFFSHPGPNIQQKLCFRHRWPAPCPPSPLSCSAATKQRNTAKLNALHLMNTHPFHHLFTLLPSGRHYRALKRHIYRQRDSFYPTAIHKLNSHPPNPIPAPNTTIILTTVLWSNTHNDN